ncbi:hypothetical protein HanPSC8_Chr11g0459381 [Helianthus annuus]|nr:hypothetical protein HanPSC8_Chr11g0459381 [Helianthus annuus]
MRLHGYNGRPHSQAIILLPYHTTSMPLKNAPFCTLHSLTSLTLPDPLTFFLSSNSPAHECRFYPYLYPTRHALCYHDHNYRILNSKPRVWSSGLTSYPFSKPDPKGKCFLPEVHSSPEKWRRMYPNRVGYVHDPI